MGRLHFYDPANPFTVGERVEYATSDHEDADTRELDATTATVLEVGDGPNDPIRVESQYGIRWDDPYCFAREAADDMRRDLADMLKAKGADDAGVAKMLGLVDDFAERVRAEDKARDDALGLLVYRELHNYAGHAEEWASLGDGRREYIAAAKAVEDKIDAEYEALEEEVE